MEKKHFKIISVILAVVLAVGVVSTVSFSVYADDGSNTKPSVAVSVPKVKGLKKTSSDISKITIKWKPVKNAYGYCIYKRNVDKKGSLKKYKIIKKTKVTIKNLLPTSYYQFGVKAVMKKNGKKYYSKISTINTYTNTLEVTGVKQVSAKKSITIKWNKRARATGYYVYRASAKSNGDYVKYKSIEGNKNTKFTDKKVAPGKLYYYRVKAYREYKKINKTSVSKISESKVLATPGLDAVKTKASSRLYRVTLSWSKNKTASKYNVYYSTKKNGKFKKLGSTSSTSFETKKLTAGKRYYFKVLPCKVVGNTVFASASTKVISKKVSDEIFGHSIGQSYIEIDTTSQHMWMYKRGKLITETDVVTGNDDGVHNTPKGVWSMMCHNSPSRLVGETWDVQVQYWMQFTSDGCGIHDSTWRGSWEYGGTTYKGNGSHGCVNTPLGKVAKIYNNSYVGYTIIVR